MIIKVKYLRKRKTIIKTIIANYVILYLGCKDQNKSKHIPTYTNRKKKVTIHLSSHKIIIVIIRILRLNYLSFACLLRKTENQSTQNASKHGCKL